MTKPVINGNAFQKQFIETNAIRNESNTAICIADTLPVSLRGEII